LNGIRKQYKCMGRNNMKKWKASLLATAVAGTTILAIIGYREVLNSIVNGITIDSLSTNE